MDPVAVHEAGHAFVAWRCGRSPGPVTVKPGVRWGGMTHCGVVPVGGPLPLVDPSLPVPCWDADVRKLIDVEALTVAAGDAAETVLWRPRRASMRTAEPVVAQAADLALTQRERRLLDADRADTAGPTDAEQLAKLAALVHPDDGRSRAAWLEWIARQAEGLIAAGAGRVERLAAALGEAGELSGRAVRAVLEGP